MKHLKSTTYRATKVLALQASIERATKQIEKLSDLAARSTCPVKLGDVFRVRDPHTKRTSYWRAYAIRGEVDRRRKVIEWRITGTACTARGDRRPGTKYDISPRDEVELTMPIAKVNALEQQSLEMLHG